MSVAISLAVRPARAKAATCVSVYSLRLDLRAGRLRLAMVRAGVAHRYVDLGAHPEAWRTFADLDPDASRQLPIVEIDGEWLSRPDPRTLIDALHRHDLI